MINPIFDPYLSSCDCDVPFEEDVNFKEGGGSYLERWQQRRRRIRQRHRINSLAIFRGRYFSLSEKSFSQMTKKPVRFRCFRARTR